MKDYIGILFGIAWLLMFFKIGPSYTIPQTNGYIYIPNVYSLILGVIVLLIAFFG